ncbi:DsbA family protein [Phenylobacterium montanum]|uniref:DsbA family protein n=1 Tax=Phenylobacterium montanum TaxID=2823693 RepID=A0A975FZC2_9CAUL|nr:DsbA family protein [Caulobacter sp. S6]QUD87101.1 DsbA family protein [Caulobacter sp. S6]
MRLFDRRVLVLAAALSVSLAGCDKLFGNKAAATADDMSMGNPAAKVTVIEYASASCPHCARFNDDVFPAFKAKYIDTGKINYVFREFLTPPENFAAAGFLTARCAGKDNYFKVLDTIYHDQTAIYQSGDFHGGLLRIAQSAGLSESQFNNCVNDEKAINQLQDRVERYAKQDGITGTPTFFVNGKKLDGEQTLASLDAAIAAAQAGK